MYALSKEFTPYILDSKASQKMALNDVDMENVAMEEDTFQ